MKCCLLLYLLPVEGILEWPVTSRVPFLFLYVFSLSRALLKPPCTLFIAPVSMLVVEFWHANCTVVSVSWVTEMLCSCTPASHQLRDRKTNTSADTQEKLKRFFSLHVVLQLQLHFCYNVCKASCSLVWRCPCWRPKQQLPEQEVNPGLSAAFRSIETCPD